MEVVAVRNGLKSTPAMEGVGRLELHPGQGPAAEQAGGSDLQVGVQDGFDILRSRGLGRHIADRRSGCARRTLKAAHPSASAGQAEGEGRA